MSEEQKIETMRKFDFREAAAEQVAEASGMTTKYHEVIVEQFLRDKYPGEFAAMEKAQKALEVHGTALKGVTLAVEAELAALNEPIIEHQPQATEKAWA